MKLELIDKDSLAFSFWAGYILLEWYHVEFENDEKPDLKTTFPFLKKMSFGKFIENPFNANWAKPIPYGIYDLDKITLDNYRVVSPIEFLQLVRDFILAHYNMTEDNMKAFPRLDSIVTARLEKELPNYPIILAEENNMPVLETIYRYDFFKSFMLLSEDHSRFLCLEIGCD